MVKIDAGKRSAARGRLEFTRCFRVSYVVAASCSVVVSQEAGAAEGAVYGGPIGGTDLRVAYAPAESGFYGGIVGLFAHGDAAFGNDGSYLPLKTNTNVGVAAGSILYAYPLTILGGKIDSFAQQGYKWGSGYVGPHQGSANGYTDTFAEIIGWSRYLGPVFGDEAGAGPPFRKKLPYGLTVKVAYSMIFPDGHYHSEALFPSGHNVPFYIPNASFSYLTSPNWLGDGLEISAHLFVDIAGYNGASRYGTGTVLDTDFAVSERTGLWQLGVAGFYAGQIDNDIEDGVIVAKNGKRLKSLDLGPVLVRDIPSLKSSFKFKYLAPISGKNSLRLQQFVLAYTFKF